MVAFIISRAGEFSACTMMLSLLRLFSINWLVCPEIYLPVAVVWQLVTGCNGSSFGSLQIFCLHGGLSPSLDTLDHIRALDRIQEVLIITTC